MKIHELPADPGKQQQRKRLGRGHGSGHGKTSGRGHKGAGARSGGVKGNGFEGGQMPLYRRLPKHGFKNPTRVEYEVVNLASLEKKFNAGETVDLAALKRVRLIRTRMPVKLLGNGEITKSLTVQVHKVSESAKTKLEAAGGKIELIVAEPKAKKSDKKESTEE